MKTRYRQTYYLKQSMAYVSIGCMVASVIIIVMSWFVNAIWPGMVTSLLTPVGMRWMVGNFASIISTEYVMWIMIIGLAWGTLRHSRLIEMIYKMVRQDKTSQQRQHNYLERAALYFSLSVFALSVIIICLLTFAPHAVLLSATGTISNSSFSSGFIPLLSTSVALTSITYGVCASVYKSVHSVFNAMVSGVRTIVPLLIVYLFVSNCYYLIQYVMG